MRAFRRNLRARDGLEPSTFWFQRFQREPWVPFYEPDALPIELSRQKQCSLWVFFKAKKIKEKSLEKISRISSPSPSPIPCEAPQANGILSDSEDSDFSRISSPPKIPQESYKKNFIKENKIKRKKKEKQSL